MNRFKIVVEGETDFKFLKDFIEYRFSPINIDREDFILTQSNNLSPQKSAIEIANERGENVLVIFDSDKDLTGAKKRIEKQAMKFNLELAGQFYFPNNELSGNLETLLLQIISEERKWIFGCINSYGDCVERQRTNDLADFNDKSRVYIYSNAFEFKDEKGKKESHTFKRASLWNLDAEYLEPLYSFLKTHFLKPKE